MYGAAYLCLCYGILENPSYGLFGISVFLSQHIDIRTIIFLDQHFMNMLCAKQMNRNGYLLAFEQLVHLNSRIQPEIVADFSVHIVQQFRFILGYLSDDMR